MYITIPTSLNLKRRGYVANQDKNIDKHRRRLYAATLGNYQMQVGIYSPFEVIERRTSL